MKNIKTFLAVLAILTVALFLGGFYISKSKKEPTEPIQLENLEQLQKSVVTIVSGIDMDNGLRTGDISIGTGLVCNKTEGYIVTNYHVVKNSKFYVLTSDNKPYKAELFAFDEKMDIAIITVKNANLTEAKFGKSQEYKVCDKVYAIGTPISPSLKNTVSDGMITGINRTGLSESKLIQSNIPSSPGLSGSPLLNIKGEIIGINTFESTEFGSQGLTFSIPADDVIYALAELEKNKKITRFYLGLEVEENQYPNFGIYQLSGVVINNIIPDSPAQQAKLMMQDRIIAINGEKIDNKAEFNAYLKTKNSGDVLEFTVLRNNEELNLKIKIIEKK